MMAHPCLDIIQGRHPVLENIRTHFVANDCQFSNVANVKLITGPNMAGKSTFLRQTALLCLMAQMGCYIPAESARLGILEKIYTRLGSGDDISNGQSTFMLEMLETADILRDMDQNTLVIIDELGRGTSYEDGFAIAQAVLEYLATTSQHKPYCLFATHYHRLAYALQQQCQLYQLQIQEQANKLLTFTYKVIEGITEHSYGINVARIAGFPEEVLQRAENLLHTIDSTT